jgi:hypothetical protein
MYRPEQDHRRKQTNRGGKRGKNQAGVKQLSIIHG